MTPGAKDWNSLVERTPHNPFPPHPLADLLMRLWNKALQFALAMFLAALALVVWVLIPISSVQARSEEPSLVLLEESLVGMLQCQRTLDRTLSLFPSDQLVSNDGGSQKIDCSHSWGCTCQGENSSDCDALFAACDKVGGLFGCASDYGFPFDTCECEI